MGSLPKAKALKKLQLKFKRETEPVIKNFHSWFEHHRNFPDQLKKFLLRDIFNYTDEEMRNLSYRDYHYALHYALNTYVRRDVLFVMSKIFKGKESSGGSKPPGTTTIIIEQPEIEQWIEEQYEGDIKE